MKKKVLVWMLSVCMVLTMMPLPAFAETGTESEGNVITVASSDYIQAAIDAAENGDTIKLLKDIDKSVTVTQAENVKITIDGDGKDFTGSITVNGKSARYDTAGLIIKNVNFKASSFDEDACINLGVSGDDNTRYTNHVTVQDCTFTSTGAAKVAIKSYTGGDKNLKVIGCTVDETMHSLLQVTNVEGGLEIDGCTVNSKNGINLNSSYGVVIKNSTIDVKGYAVRAGAGTGGDSGEITLTNNTLKTDNTEGDAVIVLRGAAVEAVDLKMSENVVSGATHISGVAADTNITADANYWDGEKAPIVSGNPVKVDSYYTDDSKENLVSVGWAAQVNGNKYESLADAFAAAEDGDTVTLLADANVTDETYTIADGVSITMDMNDKKITVTDNKGAKTNYELFYIYGELTVIGNGTIELTAANDRGWDAMSAIFHNRGGVLNIENGTFKHLGGTDMAYVIDNSGNYYGDATTNIKDGTLDSSYIAIRNRMEQNSHGASGKAILNVEGGTITAVKRAIWAQAASTSVTAPATGEINVSGGKIGLIDTPRSNGAVSMTKISGGEVAAFKGETGELTVTGGTVGEVTLLTEAGEAVDYIITEEGLYVTAVAQVGETKYPSLQEAIDAAKDGKTVKVIADIALEQAIIIEKGDKVTLDLNGKTISYESTTQNEAMITNKGDLVINDSSDDETGVINYNYTGAADSTYGKGNYTISNAGNLTVNGGKITIANIRAHAKYPIDNNSTAGDAVLVINGGHLYNYNTSAIRQFCNSATNKNSVTINGGLIEGYSAIWVQNPGKNTVNGNLTINGGEIKTTAAAYVNGTSELKDVSSGIYFTIDGEGGAWSKDSFVAFAGGTFNENVKLAKSVPENINVTGGEFKGNVSFGTNGIISGGTFITDVNAYIGDDYAMMINEDCTYGVTEESNAAKFQYEYTNIETGVTYYSDSKEALAKALGINDEDIIVNVLYLKQQIEELKAALKDAEDSSAAEKSALEKQIEELKAEIAELSKEKQLAAPVAKASNIASTGKIKLTWEAVEGADEYAVYRATSKDGSYQKMITITGTSYTNTSAKAGKTYYYKVKAITDNKSINNSELSEAIRRTCDLPRTTVKAVNVASTGKIKLTWDKVSGAEQYKVYRSTSKSGEYTLIRTMSGTSYNNTSAIAGNTYYYKVVAVDKDNTAANSAYSVVVKRTCDLKQPVVTATSTVKSQVKLTWKKVEGAKNYVVYRATSKSGKYTKIITTTKVSYTNKSLKSGKTYYYKVRAIAENSAANSAYSTAYKCTVK